MGATELDATLDLSAKTVTLPAASVTDHVIPYDDNTLKEEIALLGFRTAANGSLAKYNLVDQTIDGFEDASGVSPESATGVLHTVTAGCTTTWTAIPRADTSLAEFLFQHVWHRQRNS